MVFFFFCFFWYSCCASLSLVIRPRNFKSYVPEPVCNIMYDMYWMLHRQLERKQIFPSSRFLSLFKINLTSFDDNKSNRTCCCYGCEPPFQNETKRFLFCFAAYLSPQSDAVESLQWHAVFRPELYHNNLGLLTLLLLRSSIEFTQYS